MLKFCSEENCNIIEYAKDLCRKHYTQKRFKEHPELRDYYKEYNRKWRIKHPDYNKLKMRKLSKTPKYKKNKLSYHFRKRNQALDLFGNKCEVCKDIENLQFHHRIYVESHQQNVHLEVLRHPDRFVLLCRTCHLLVGIAKNHPRKYELVYQHIQQVRIF